MTDSRFQLSFQLSKTLFLKTTPQREFHKIQKKQSPEKMHKPVVARNFETLI